MSSDKLTAIERLESILQDKDERVRELEEQVELLRSQVDGSAWGWSIGRQLPEEQELPVPRLELVFEAGKSGWADFSCTYMLVYRHALGHCVAIPLGRTRVCGHSGDGPFGAGGSVYLPHREAHHISHDAATLGWPAFTRVVHPDGGEQVQHARISSYSKEWPEQARVDRERIPRF